MHLNHADTIPQSVCGKIFLHKTSPWCQKGWGPLLILHLQGKNPQLQGQPTVISQLHTLLRFHPKPGSSLHVLHGFSSQASL